MGFVTMSCDKVGTVNISVTHIKPNETEITGIP
jgi:hypothetical protein